MNEEEAAVAGESLGSLSKIPEGKYSSQVLQESDKEDTIRYKSIGSRWGRGEVH